MSTPILTKEFLKRFPVDTIAMGIDGNPESTPAHIRGHFLYLKQATPPRIMVDRSDGETVELHRPDKSEILCDWFKVMAKGVKVGKRREGIDKAKRKRLDVARRYVDAISVGDFVLLAEAQPPGMIHRSPYSQNEIMVDESRVIAYCEAKG